MKTIILKDLPKCTVKDCIETVFTDSILVNGKPFFICNKCKKIFNDITIKEQKGIQLRLI